MSHSLRGYRNLTAAVCVLLLGCVPEVADLPTGDNSSSNNSSSSNGSNDQPEQVLAVTPPPPPTVEVEPNDDYAHATPAAIGASFELQGKLGADSNSVDLDFFALGPVETGDIVTAEMDVDPMDDIVLAIMDDQEGVLAYLDLTYAVSGPPTINLSIHQPSAALYVLITSRSISTSLRPYTATLGLQRAGELPEVSDQVIVLNFQGAENVSVANRYGFSVPPFDAAVIDPRYEGFTNTIINNIAQIVADDFDGVGVRVYIAGQGGIPSGPHSTVHFGNYDSQLLGLAENIDPYNADLEQTAIVYTDTFAVFQPISPSVVEMSQAIANVASHEIGHLLGLRHTSDPQDLMDITANATQLLADQWFRFAYLNPEVLPLGLQNSPSLLSWSLGGSLGPPPSGKQLAAVNKSINLANRGININLPRCQFHDH